MHRFVKFMTTPAERDGLPRSITALVISCFALLCFAVLTALFVAERAEKAYGWVTDTTEVREAARDTLDALQDAERGQPGFF